MNKKIISFALAASMVFSLGFSACTNSPINNDDKNKVTQVTPAETTYETYSSVNSENYNKDLYYINELKFEIADPTVIYVDHGEEEGYFYAYGTSDLVFCYGIQCWRSNDLTNWEYVGVAYQPDMDTTWAYTNHWAPEVLFDAELNKYLMFFNADWLARNNDKYMSVVFSDNPYGPFVPAIDYSKPAYDFSIHNSQIPKELQRRYTIDAHGFVDPVTGDKYLYYSGYGVDGNGVNHGQTIFGVKMLDWLTPDYSTVKELTKLNNTTVDGITDDIQEGGSVNEGAFVWYNEGKYYLTFSVYPYTNPNYQVRQAIADSPLGNYTKISVEDGGAVIASDVAWGTITSAGHHCFIQCGNELMIAYHTFLNRNDISNGRALAVDPIKFVTNSNGLKVMHANGPTYSYQPLPEEISGYKNLASLANVTVNSVNADSKKDYLTDGLLKVHSSDPVNEFKTAGGSLEIVMEFPKFVNVRALLIYNSTEYYNAFWGINSIKLQYKSGEGSLSEATYTNIPFDSSWHSDSSSIIYPGANSILEINELPVKKITIKINQNSDYILALNEIVVLGKELANPAAVTEISDYSYGTFSEVQSLPVYESATFGSAGNGAFVSNFGYDLTHDDGTANAYVDKVWCGNLQKLFFKDVCSTTFYVEAELSVMDHTKTYIGDNYPKMGLMVQTKQGYFFYYHVDLLGDYTGKDVGYVQSNAAGSDYDWTNTHKLFKVSDIQYTGENFVKLAIARVGKTVYMYCNDKLIVTVDNLDGITDNENTAGAVALLTYNTFTRFKNYSITSDASEVQAKINALA